MRKPILAGNWKMQKTLAEARDYVERMRTLTPELPTGLGQRYDIVLFPASTHFAALGAPLAEIGIGMGSQTSGTSRFGAFTGEISPVVVKELGCTWVLAGHSERRHVFGEGDSLILERARAALGEGLSVMLCVGEVLQDRKAQKTFKVIERQLLPLKQNAIAIDVQRFAVAYEPVWAIGTGENATPEQAQEVHAFIRRWFGEALGIDAGELRILYGGSVKPDNARALMAQADVDGLLVGGASLDPLGFAGIIQNGLESRS